MSGALIYYLPPYPLETGLLTDLELATHTLPFGLLPSFLYPDSTEIINRHGRI